MITRWRALMAGVDGNLFQGPFSKLLEVCAQLGWSIQSAPRFIDQVAKAIEETL